MLTYVVHHHGALHTIVVALCGFVVIAFPAVGDWFILGPNQASGELLY
ncbi:MAG: hypothetical protein U9N81_13540 [Bacillota bacterium]|nr:hypothetical protein [Bacillota bacterium]